MIDSNLIYSKILFQANVFDNQDPLLLGRIRASGQTDNVQDVYNSIPDWNEETGPWSTKDPFVYLPFLPYFVSQVPENEELIQVIYQNPRIQYSNQFYIQGPFSSPMLTSFQDKTGADSMLGTGLGYEGYPPIRNNDGTYKDDRSIGVYPEPGDNALLGRGSADVVVKTDEVLLRAGKFETVNPNRLPVGYNGRGFLQLSQYRFTKRQQGFRKFTRFNEIIQSVKFLIEYVLYNPENTQNMFTGEINVYKFVGTVLTNDDFSTTKQYDDTVLTETIPFSGSMQDVIIRINNTLSTFNNDERTPFFFRPGLTTSKFLTQPGQTPNDIEKFNVSFLYSEVKPDSNATVTGSGLVFWKNAYGQQFSPEKIAEPVIDYVNKPQNIASLGSDIVFLLSHSSPPIPGKPAINLDGTLYGIPQDKFIDEIMGSTSSMVRGEELLKLLSLIVKFLVGHSHPYHQLPPFPTASNGTTVPDILQEIQQGYQKILNSNIRLN